MLRDGSGSAAACWLQEAIHTVLPSILWPHGLVEAQTPQSLLLWPLASCAWVALTSAQISGERQLAWFKGSLWLSLGLAPGLAHPSLPVPLLAKRRCPPQTSTPLPTCFSRLQKENTPLGEAISQQGNRIQWTWLDCMFSRHSHRDWCRADC